ncbi:peptidylprolyl isomerase [Malassezia vespertilionis]|uniref:peptidylprolyl isomerase n=1 Tax=Malassezia vespertilionis TaxID=2020962 RepID=UPI0024B05AED|nr:peptidylprolyl isomerase [Malassezia vespertilionis]WFD06194.1 peptidylprolyl isomerase [Malassezia vespertilionis]
MSTLYVTEPPTEGKIVLHTTKGEIEIELWSKEAPKACRNAIALALEGYYDNQLWHRIVPGFIIQTGDPTGTGTGGESIYGESFADELHQRLRFNRRGLVAMANAGTRNTNDSQFFQITLDAAPELQNKHTIFGRVVGPTIYNALALAEVEMSRTVPDRPVYPPKLFRVDVLHNPFSDLVPRTTREEREKEEKVRNEWAAKGSETARDAKKRKKNTSLLSFGDEEDVMLETPRSARKPISSHDLLDDKKLSKQSVKTVRKSSEPQHVSKAAPVFVVAPERKQEKVEEMERAEAPIFQSARQETQPVRDAQPKGRDLLASFAQQYRQASSKKGESQTLSHLDKFRKRIRDDIPDANEREYGASDEEDIAESDVSWRKHRDIEEEPGLGFMNSKSDTLDLHFDLGSISESKKRARRRREIHLSLSQNTTSLRSAKGDTGSVVWQSSIFLLTHCLRQFWDPPSDPNDVYLFQPDRFRDRNILELGAGTGIFPVGLFADPQWLQGKVHWIATDQEENMPLLQKKYPGLHISNGALILVVLQLREVENLREFLEAWAAHGMYELYSLCNAALPSTMHQGYAVFLGWSTASAE